MKVRDLLRLPVNSEIDISDKIWVYSVKKFLSEDGKPLYFVKEKSFGESFTMSEKEEDVYEDSHKYKRKVLHGCTNVCSFFFHESSMAYSLCGMKIVPRSSYRQTFITN